MIRGSNLIGATDFLLSKLSRPSFRRKGYWVLFPGIWRPVPAAVQLPPPNAEIKRECRYTAIPLTFLYGTDKDSFNFYLFCGVLYLPATKLPSYVEQHIYQIP